MEGVNSSIRTTRRGGQGSEREDEEFAGQGFRWGTGAYSGGYGPGLSQAAGGEEGRGRRSRTAEKDSRSRSRSASRSKSRERLGAGIVGQLSIRDWANPMDGGSREGRTELPSSTTAKQSRQSSPKENDPLDEDDSSSFDSCMSLGLGEEEEDKESGGGGDMEETRADGDTRVRGGRETDTEMEPSRGERDKLGAVLGVGEDQGDKGAGGRPSRHHLRAIQISLRRNTQDRTYGGSRMASPRNHP